MKFYNGTGAAPKTGEVLLKNRVLTTQILDAQNDPSQYILVGDPPDMSGNGMKVVRAVNTALALGMPLLVSGEPGCGKTQLASSIAYELGKPRPLKFVTKSTSVANDLLYEYDAIRHFNARGSDNDIEKSALKYIRYTALGRAILLGLPTDIRSNYLLPIEHLDETDDPHQDLRYIAPHQSVVIIDEIDKAPRDFPNDLLNELENFNFRVPEIGGYRNLEISDNRQMRPIVIITTNSERLLPDAFLRRCAYVHLEHPTGERLKTILKSRLDVLLDSDSVFMRDVREFYEDLRKNAQMDKAPGIAELLQFCRSAAEVNVNTNKTIGSQAGLLSGALCLLSKTRADMEKVETALNSLAGRSATNG